MLGDKRIVSGGVKALMNNRLSFIDCKLKQSLFPSARALLTRPSRESASHACLTRLPYAPASHTRCTSFGQLARVFALCIYA